MVIIIKKNDLGFLLECSDGVNVPI